MSGACPGEAVLKSGYIMPRLGLGLWGPREGPEARRAVLAAVEAGYRLFDTASVYENEKSVGLGLKESGLKRADYFVTGKVWNDSQGPDAPKTALKKSLANLGLDYLDLYLIHWPVASSGPPTWQALESLRKENLVRSVGLANYSPEQLKKLYEETGLCPDVWQTELHPFRHQVQAVELAAELGIKIMAACPLARGRLRKNQIIGRLARKYQKTPAQIILRWGWQMGWTLIPKSVRPERIRENAGIFDFFLEEKDLSAISRLNQDQSVLKPPFFFDREGYVLGHQT
ncbi:MAG: aldo/keto reductase [Deltaproteobacteria bacterium]|jgi:diketogulonate reductase-like aldo/keto reductase|nr:aldo/keto reductase [Deltaproteobacteria bacterium]